MPIDSMLVAKYLELVGMKLVTSICPQCFHGCFRFLFCKGLEIFEFLKRFALLFEQDSPHIPSVIIYQDENISFLAWCGRRNGATEITMD